MGGASRCNVAVGESVLLLLRAGDEAAISVAVSPAAVRDLNNNQNEVVRVCCVLSKKQVEKKIKRDPSYRRTNLVGDRNSE